MKIKRVVKILIFDKIAASQQKVLWEVRLLRLKSHFGEWSELANNHFRFPWFPEKHSYIYTCLHTYIGTMYICMFILKRYNWKSLGKNVCHNCWYFATWNQNSAGADSFTSMKSLLSDRLMLIALMPTNNNTTSMFTLRSWLLSI